MPKVLGYKWKLSIIWSLYSKQATHQQGSEVTGAYKKFVYYCNSDKRLYKEIITSIICKIQVIVLWVKPKNYSTILYLKQVGPANLKKNLSRHIECWHDVYSILDMMQWFFKYTDEERKRISDSDNYVRSNGHVLTLGYDNLIFIF